MSGEYLSREQVASRLSPADRKVSAATVYKWATRGVKVGGRPVVLKATRLPGGLAFRREDVDAFIAELNGGEVPGARPERSGAKPIERCADDQIGVHPAVAS